MIKAIYPGTFDPVTYGHIDVIERASKMYDELIVGVLENKSKKHLLSMDERVDLIIEVTKHLKNVTVQKFEGLSVDFAKMNDAKVIVRGLRAVTDFEFEVQMFQTNYALNADVDTVFFATKNEYSHISSSGVREVVAFGGDISGFVPKAVENKVLDIINNKKAEK